MMFDEISIIGITDFNQYPEKCTLKNCKQNLKSISVTIPCEKPNIESINEIKILICSENTKTINTILGKKSIINLVVKVKIIYTALNETQSVHSAHWEISFCDFILNNNNDCHCPKTSDMFIGLEDVYIHSFDERNINLSILYIICNFFNGFIERNKSNNSCCDEYNQNIKYEENVKNTNYTNRNTHYYPVDFFIKNHKKVTNEKNCNNMYYK